MLASRDDRIWLHLPLATANFGFAVYGIFRLTVGFQQTVAVLTKHAVLVFLAMIVVNVLAALTLLVAGGLFLCSSSLAVRFCKAMFIVEIAYALLILSLWLLPTTAGDLFAAVTDIGNPVIAPQLRTGYPVWALFLFWLNARRGDSA